MCAGTASYSNSRQNHSVLYTAPWEGEMWKSLDSSTWGKKEFHSSTVSEPIQLMAVFSICKLVGTDLGWGFLFILKCLDLILLQSLRQSDETTKTFKCLRDIRPAVKTDRKLLGPALHFPP